MSEEKKYNRKERRFIAQKTKRKKTAKYNEWLQKHPDIVKRREERSSGVVIDESNQSDTAEKT